MTTILLCALVGWIAWTIGRGRGFDAGRASGASDCRTLLGQERDAGARLLAADRAACRRRTERCARIERQGLTVLFGRVYVHPAAGRRERDGS